MATVLRYFNPFHLNRIRKNVKNDGFGRFVMTKIGHRPNIQPYLFWPAQRLLKAMRIAARPLEYVKRKHIARQITSKELAFSRSAGYRFLDRTMIPNIDEVIGHCRKTVKVWERENVSKRKALVSHILRDADGVTDLTNHGPIQELAQHPKIVGAVCEYLGEVPVIGSLTIQISHVNSSEEGFQKFHIDRVDRRQMKLFIAIDDVTEERGPLHFIPAAESAIMEKKERHFAGRLDDDVVASYAGEKGIISAIMKAGEGLFIDTCTCAHYGSRGNTEPRYLLLFHYISKFSPIKLHTHGEKIKPNASLIPQGGASIFGGCAYRIQSRTRNNGAANHRT